MRANTYNLIEVLLWVLALSARRRCLWRIHTAGAGRPNACRPRRRRLDSHYVAALHATMGIRRWYQEEDVDVGVVCLAMHLNCTWR